MPPSADHITRSVQNQLLAAIRCGNTNEVRDIVKSLDVPISKTRSEGFDLLRCAMKYDKQATAELLLSFNCSVKNKNSNSDSLLNLAVWKSSTPLIRKLLSRGADVSVQDKNGYTPVHLAVIYGRSGAVIEVLLGRKLRNVVDKSSGENGKSSQEDTPVVNKTTDNGFTPLYLAARSGNAELCASLLQCGADPNISDFDGETPLHLAFAKDSPEITGLLLQNGADPSAPTKDGVTPIFFAVKQKRGELLEVLLSHGAEINVSNFPGGSPLLYAVKNTYSPYYDPRTVPSNIRHVCDKYSCPRMKNEQKHVKTMLEWGANVDAKNAKGSTVLHIAIEKRDYHMVELLLRFNVNAFRENNEGVTPIYLACLKSQADILALLLLYCDINVSDKDNKLYNLIFNMLIDKNSNRSLLHCCMALERHIGKLKAADLLTNNLFLNLPIDLTVYPNFQTETDLEIANMKRETISGTSLSFYDLLTSSSTELTTYMRLDSFRSASKTSFKDLEGKFGYYTAMIGFKIKRADRRVELFKEFEAIFSGIFSFLPELCVDKILSFLTDQQLRRLIRLSNRNETRRMSK